MPADNILQKLADKQGVTLEEFATKVYTKSQDFDECVATAIAKRNLLQAAVQARSGQDLLDLDVSFHAVEPEVEQVTQVEEEASTPEGE